MKRLVVCCDGTWNTPDMQQGGVAAPTNVTRTALVVSPRDEHGVEQRMFYHPGVGTRRSERLRGGAFGFGLSRDVRDVYRFLVRHFEPGDEVFLLGFSRGAYTARSCAGLVRNAGILRPDEIGRVDEAYELYRSRAGSTHPRATESVLFRQSFARETRIHFVGVWDTVGALGVPLSGLRWANALNRRWQFHDTTLSSWVDNAFQALSIDEKRKPFAPTVWVPPDDPGEQRLEQVWFAGVHCDVGGGYADTRLPDIPLRWLAGRAQECGLALDRPPAEVDPEASVAPLHESRTGFYRLIPPYARPIGTTDPGHESVAEPVLARHERTAYAPPGLTAYLRQPDRRTTSV